MKVIKVARADDLEPAAAYLDVAERLMFDAKPPKGRKDALPGGNAVAFDWQILAGRSWPRPWMLAGGLTAAGEALTTVRRSAAGAITSPGWALGRPRFAPAVGVVTGGPLGGKVLIGGGLAPDSATGALRLVRGVEVLAP